MKKLLLSSAVIAATALICMVISAHAAQRQPPFFVPQKVLDQMNQPEKLPPVEQMTYDNKPAPLILEQRQKAAQAEKERQEKIAKEKHFLEQKQQLEELAEQKRQEVSATQKTDAENKISEKTKADTSAPNTQAVPSRLTPTQTPQQAETKPQKIVQTPKPTNPPATPAASEPQTVATESSSQAPAKSKETPSAEATPPINNSQRTFDDIIADYKRDALGISQGKPINNPRLRDILQDYSAARHVL